MDKKILALIIVIILLVVVGGVFAFINSNRNNNRTENTVNGGASEDNQSNSQVTGKVLVLYFSQSGNTEKVANFIHDEVGGDLIKLEVAKAYPSDYNELVNYAQEEQRNNSRPELKTKISNIDEYDTIFLGYPNWWADMPMPLYTFLDEYDLSGKTIKPFATNAGWIGRTFTEIKKLCPNSKVEDGLNILYDAGDYRTRKLLTSLDEIDNWINTL